MEHNDFKRSLYKEDPKDPEKPHYTQWGLKSPEEATLIRLFVNDLGFPSGATTKQIYAKAKALGLELCPPEVGPQFRLQYISRPMYESVYVGMKQIIGSDRNPRVFRVGRDVDGSRLGVSWARPTERWDTFNEFVFRLRKKT